jgi:fumarate reductase subunit D
MKIGLMAAIAGLIAAAEVAPSMGGFDIARLTAVTVLGYIVIILVKKLDKLSDAINDLRIHCARKE